jgi:hypothetical protein
MSAVQLGFLAFALVMACVAGGVVLYCFITEVTEAWDISRRGWTRGHHTHHRMGGHRGATVHRGP